MTIPFVDMKAQFSSLERAIRSRMNAVLDHGQFIMGPEVKELEGRLAAYAGTKHCITCASGTDALLMAMMVHRVGPGDYVVTTPFTFFATAEVIALQRATPLFADIDPRTFNLDPEQLDRTLQSAKTTGKRVKGVIAVDLFGLPCDYDAIHEIARKHGVWVVQDAAQSFGSEYNGKKACAQADIACTSFFPAKPLGCYGDGGAVFTNDDAVATEIASLRIHGQGVERYTHARIGLASRLDTLQAAILLPKLDALDGELTARRLTATRYSQAIGETCRDLQTPATVPNRTSAWAQYTLLSRSAEHRTRLREALSAAGVPTAVHYPVPLHLQQAFAHLGLGKGSFPVSEDFANRVFSLPMHAYLDEPTVDMIVAALAKG